MKANIKIISVTLALALAALITCIPVVFSSADKIEMPTTYPSAKGVYSSVRLVPRAALSGACQIGTFYLTTSNQMMYCIDNGGFGAWAPLPDVWTQNGDNIYLTDTIADPQLRVGIGTTTPEFKLTLKNDGGIMAKGTFGAGNTLPALAPGSHLIWYPRKAAFRAGSVSGAQWNDANIGNYSVAMGQNTTASGSASLVVGGDANTASADYAVIGGGQGNTASQRAAVVLGGQSNNVSGRWSVIGGGNTNAIGAFYATIVGGSNNQIHSLGMASTIGGGLQNYISLRYSFIGGGQQNAIINGSDGFSTIGGGRGNQLSADYQTIGGGANNISSSNYTTIIGGATNLTQPITRSAVLYQPSYSTILGGENNTAQGGDYSVVGGSSMGVDAKYGVSVGGSANAVGTQEQGWNFDNMGSVAAGGQTNIIGKQFSTIIGGESNKVWGNYSWAAGRGMLLGLPAGLSDADASFMWGHDFNAVPITADIDNSFIIASGRVGIRDLAPAAVLEINANGTADHYLNIGKNANGNIFTIKRSAVLNNPVLLGSSNAGPVNAWDFGNTSNNAFLSTAGVWTSPSSRELKDKIRPISATESIDALKQLRPVTFDYKLTGTHGVGFIAQEVPDIVAMNDRTAINSLDVIAVLVQAAKEQNEQIQKQEKELNDMELKIRQLNERFNTFGE